MAVPQERQPKSNRPISFEWFATEEPRYAQMNKAIIESALQSVGNGDYVLDNCCAVGVNTKIIVDYLKSHAVKSDVIGTDINPLDLEKARRREPRAMFLRVNATSLRNLPSSFFRVGFLLNAIHEIQGATTKVIDGVEQEVDNKELAIKELFRVVKRGGEVVIVSGFTSEMFNFPDRPRGAREETIKHGELRKRAIAKLGQKDPNKPAFTPLLTKQYLDWIRNAGFIDITVEKIQQNYDTNSMKLIGEDPGWLWGTYQDMANAENISDEKKRDAFHAALDELQAEYETEHPGKLRPYPRMFVVIRARKPGLNEPMPQSA